MAIEKMLEYGEITIENSIKGDGTIMKALQRSQNLQTVPGYDRFLRTPIGGMFTEDEVVFMRQNAPRGERQAREAMKLKKQKL